MKLLVLTSQVFELGGAEKLSLELVYGLNNTSVKADLGIVFKSPSSTNTNSSIINSLEEKPGNWFSLDTPINPSLIDLIKAVFQLIKLIKERKYTHVETSLVTPSIIASIACVFTNCKSLVGFHQSYKPFLSKDLKYKLFFFLTKLSRNIHFYGISDFVVSSWVKSKKINSNPIITIYNSYDVNFDFKNYQSNKLLTFGTNKFVILCVGRITKHKGYHILFDSIKNELKLRNIALYFLGSPDTQTDGEHEELDRVKSEINSLGLHEHVFFLGFKKQTISYLKSCDLLVHPTEFEGFGLVLIEAMLLKKPIITMNVDAIPEILAGTGIVQLPYGNLNILKDEIIKFLNNPEIYNNSIENGFHRALQFNLSNRVNEIINYCSKH
jgi:glycosyltransferase involved in cell wall biosynthesis